METRRVNEAIAFSEEKMRKNSLFETDQLFYDVYCLLSGQFQKIRELRGAVREGGPASFLGREGERVLRDITQNSAVNGQEKGITHRGSGLQASPQRETRFDQHTTPVPALSRESAHVARGIEHPPPEGEPADMLPEK